MEIYSHRGIGLGPENSLASMREAKKRGLRYETDIRKTKDGILVLHHDSKHVENKTYEQLSKQGAELCPARLEDALDMGLFFDLELKKSANTGTVLKMVEDRDMLDNVIFTSFYPWKVRQIKEKNKKATVGLLTTWQLPEIILPVIAKTGMDYILPHTDTVTEGFVKKAHDSGLKVVTWCGSTETNKQSAEDCGIDGIIINL